MPHLREVGRRGCRRRVDRGWSIVVATAVVTVVWLQLLLRGLLPPGGRSGCRPAAAGEPGVGLLDEGDEAIAEGVVLLLEDLPLHSEKRERERTDCESLIST